MNWEQLWERRERAELVTDTMLEQVDMVQGVLEAALQDLYDLDDSNAPLPDLKARGVALYQLVREWSREQNRVLDRMHAEAAEYYV